MTIKDTEVVLEEDAMDVADQDGKAAVVERVDVVEAVEVGIVTIMAEEVGGRHHRALRVVYLILLTEENQRSLPLHRKNRQRSEELEFVRPGHSC